METQIALFHDKYPKTVNKRHLMIREQPNYRVATKSEACSLVELLSVIIGGQDCEAVASDLLAKAGTIHRLATMPCGELMEIEGIGRQTAIRIKATFELGKKILSPVDHKTEISTPDTAADVFTPILANKEQEILAVILLDTRNRLIEACEVYRGSLNSSMVRVAEVFKPAIRANAASIIVGHNHPSMDANASPQDIALTRGLVVAGGNLDISVLDHIVYGSPGNFTSLKHAGLVGFS